MVEGEEVEEGGGGGSDGGGGNHKGANEARASLQEYCVVLREGIYLLFVNQLLSCQQRMGVSLGKGTRERLR